MHHCDTQGKMKSLQQGSNRKLMTAFRKIQQRIVAADFKKYIYRTVILIDGVKYDFVLIFFISS